MLDYGLNYDSKLHIHLILLVGKRKVFAPKYLGTLSCLESGIRQISRNDSLEMIEKLFRNPEPHP